ncbi:hypothetical protein, partial [Klebsiella quasipneumoniae]|uniref:hypothetical protein n=1 Tax=Klebsiella quasipneumoniae TaxID=1463165 RepID=UPI003007D2F1
TVCVVGKIRDLILQLSKSSIYSTKPFPGLKGHTGPVLIYLKNGAAEKGFPLRQDEFVTSLKSLDEAYKKAGLPPVSQD